MFPPAIAFTGLVSVPLIISNNVQLTRRAKYKEDVLEFFSEVMAPEVIRWQGKGQLEKKQLGDLLLEFSKVAPLPKVSISHCYVSTVVQTNPC